MASKATITRLKKKHRDLDRLIEELGARIVHAQNNDIVDARTCSTLQVLSLLRRLKSNLPDPAQPNWWGTDISIRRQENTALEKAIRFAMHTPDRNEILADDWAMLIQRLSWPYQRTGK
jgi:hypothetical protein